MAGGTVPSVSSTAAIATRRNCWRPPQRRRCWRPFVLEREARLEVVELLVEQLDVVIVVLLLLEVLAEVEVAVKESELEENASL